MTKTSETMPAARTRDGDPCLSHVDLGAMFTRTIMLRDHLRQMLPEGVFLSRVSEGATGFPMFEVHAGGQFVQVGFDPTDMRLSVAEMLRDGEELVTGIVRGLQQQHPAEPPPTVLD